ncbi:hypothetical protein MRX96_031909 [Rhipicephalus microplus]
MRSIIVLPILLILDSYDQIYQCGGLGNICTFQKCTNVVLHKHPRLYDPTTQCAIYHKTLCDMHVDIKDGDSYHNLILKYLRIVFFGRYANSRSENEKEYAPIFKLIRTWYQFIACMMLNTSSASHSSIMSYTKRPAISPNAKMVCNIVNGQSTLSFVSNLKEPATSFDYMRSIFTRKRKEPVMIAKSEQEAQTKIRRFDLTDDENISNDEAVTNNVVKLHKKAIMEYEKAVAEFSDGEEDLDVRDIIKPPNTTSSVLDNAKVRRNYFPDLTNNDVKENGRVL